MKYLKYFEGFDIKSIPHAETQFKDLIKKIDPLNYNKYITLLKNKGLEFARNRLLNDNKHRQEVEKEIKRIRRYDDRSRQALGGVTTDDLSYFTPDKKEIKGHFNHLLTNNLKNIYTEYGVHKLNGVDIWSPFDSDVSSSELTNKIILNSDNFEYNNTSRKYDRTIEVKFWDHENIDASLGTVVNLIENEIEPDENVIKLLNETRVPATFRRDFDINYDWKICGLWKEMLTNDLFVNIVFYIKDDYNDKSEYYTLLREGVNNKMSGKFVSMHDEHANELLNKIQNATVKSFIEVSNKIKTNKKRTIKHYNNFIKHVTKLIIESLEHSGIKYYRNVQLIKEHFPKTFKLIEPFLNKDGLDKAIDMGNMGFSD